MKVDNIEIVENCLKNVAKEYQYRKRKEIYNIDLEVIKKMTIRCKEFIESMQNEYGKNNTKFKKNINKIKKN
jgi:hypothetical protein